MFSQHAVTGADQGTIRNSVREELSETSRLLLRCRLGGGLLVLFIHVQGLHPAKTNPNAPEKEMGQPTKGKRYIFQVLGVFYLFQGPGFAQVACFTDFTQLSWGKKRRSQKRSPEMGLRWRKYLDSLTKLPPSKHLTLGFQSVIFC